MGNYALRGDTVTYSIVLAACQKSLRWQQVLEVLEMLPCQSTLDAQLCASAIDACARGAQAEDAVRFLEALVFAVKF